MIRGVGVDIIEVGRVEEALTRRPRLVRRLFASDEIAYCRAKPASEYSHFAGRFAAKEAVAKALGRSCAWHDVVVSHDPRGKPVVELFGRAREAAQDGTIRLTISHSRDYAVAYAVFEAREPAESPGAGGTVDEAR